MSESEPQLRIAQVTDPHLFADPEGRLKGVATLETFDAILAEVKQHTPLDLILMTGDLVHDESIAGYERLRERMQPFGVPVYCLPGNHDEGRLIGTHLNQDNMHTVRAAHHDDWLFVFLDSSIPGSAAGNLSDDEWLAFEERINGNDAQHILICVHHNPLPVGSAWLDTMTIRNGAEFTRICQHHPKVRGVLFGHIHQDFYHQVDQLQLIGSPSTCIQFKPGSADFALDEQPPGFRLLQLYANGHIDTQVYRLAQLPEGLDLSPEGY